MRRYYVGFAQMFVEIVKSAAFSPAEICRRVQIVNLEAAARMSRARSVGAAGRRASVQLGMDAARACRSHSDIRVDAAYKPLIDNWAEREMLKIRSRFGAAWCPLRSCSPTSSSAATSSRAIAMVADQEPTKSEHKHWVRFLNRDTAFFMGAEEIARVTHFPVFFITLKRTARGFYEMEFKPLATAAETLKSGELTERYARMVEQQIRAAPPDWPWSHKRWRLKRSLYAR